MTMAGSQLPHGLLSLDVLPAARHDNSWDKILVPRETKEALLNHALLHLRHGRALSTLASRSNGLIVIAGPPGTGKTTLARGLAHVAADALAAAGATTFAEIDSYALPSDLLGESGRNVTRLMNETLPELAAQRPHLIAVVDEVESLAVRRSTASFESNPVDVHRATDALLNGLDHLADRRPGTLLVVTTNFPDAVDDAFLSRADLVMDLDLPDEEAVAAIVADSLAELSGVWPNLAGLAADVDLHQNVAALCAGWDGRRIRKLVLSAIARRGDVVADPGQLKAVDLLAVARR